MDVFLLNPSNNSIKRKKAVNPLEKFLQPAWRR
jgi:hypothetical protein